MSYNKLDPFNDGSLKHLYEFKGNANDSVGGVNGSVKTGSVEENYMQGAVSYGTLPELNNTFTISIKVNANGKSLDYEEHIISNAVSDGSNQTGIRLFIKNDTEVIFQLGDGERESQSCTLPNNLAFSSNEWIHFTLTYANDMGILYCNGIKIGELKHRNTNNTFYSGYDGNDNRFYFSGIYNDLSIFDRALTQEEVAYLYDPVKVIGTLQVDDRGSALTGLEVVENVTDATKVFSDYFTLDLNGTLKQHTKVPEDWGNQEFKVKATNVAGSSEETFKIVTKVANSKDLLSDGSEIAFYKFENDANDEYGNNAIATAVNFDGNKAIFNGTNSSSKIELPSPVVIKNKSISFVINQADYIYYNNDPDQDVMNSMIFGMPDHTIDESLLRPYKNNWSISGKVPDNPYVYIDDVELQNNIDMYIVVTIDNNNLLKLYKDGQYLGSKTLAGDFSISVLGEVFNPSSYSFDGNLKHLRVFNKALTQEEVTKIYNIEKGV